MNLLDKTPNYTGVKQMVLNVGTLDRTLRIVGGIALIAMAVFGKIGAWGYIGIVPLITGIFRFCPAYRLIGLSTCPPSAGKT